METQIDSEGRVWYAAYSVEEVQRRPRRMVIDEQPVALWIWKNTPFAVDANCYHAGGALEQAVDIEEVSGQACIRCPLHRYVISIETGESFYQPVEFEKCPQTGKMVPVPLPWKSKGVKQRPHLAKVEGQRVWISLVPRKQPVASDKYAVATLNRE
ncbi:putative nitrite reductase small subunit [Neospora caninum Liverpool]|uniref:Putative nitrite reductase small subunit n=1 Tax=Neospora caninum (strain Liverpool) TaxID=572307 RepID=F0VR76_NEOCL|nr:putative nitrite reductase small subunit [Neospora caninum Liverpool]CBZ56224.1 putative nitrite reductase small subunit [Neospora caninum Liverpool]|eukprot:XP_003886249.1 putative nitrite reductase small subunit [Neospora caninum Liverpool]